MSLAHHSLVTWQRADDLFIRLHQLSLKAFPAHERFELVRCAARRSRLPRTSLKDLHTHPVERA
jgi:hypothetical protein